MAFDKNCTFTVTFNKKNLKMNYPEHYYFTRKHEWVNIVESIAETGLTELAQKN